jgi:hypothetical protein
MKKTLKFLTILLALGLVFSACKKDEEGTSKGKGALKVAGAGLGKVMHIDTYNANDEYQVLAYGPGKFMEDGVVHMRATETDWPRPHDLTQTHNIRVTRLKDMQEFTAFCAYGWSSMYGDVNNIHVAIEQDAENLPRMENVRLALNFIYNKYKSIDGWIGSFYAAYEPMWEGPFEEWQGDGHYPTMNLLHNYSRVISQAVVWRLMHPNRILDIEVLGANDAPDWMTPLFKTAIDEVMDLFVKEGTGFRYIGTPIQTPIVKVAYISCDGRGTDDGTLSPYHYFQPHILPIWGDNTPPPVLGPAFGTVTATNAGNVPVILDGLNPKNGNAKWDPKAPFDPEKTTQFVVPNSNHFVFAKATRTELEAGVALEFLVGNKFQVVGTGNVHLIDGELVITIDKFGKGSFGCIAFNQLPVTNNGNIHSQKEADLKKLGAVTGFNHDNKLTIPCPAGDEIYLYIHCGTIQFWQ